MNLGRTAIGVLSLLIYSIQVEAGDFCQAALARTHQQKSSPKRVALLVGGVVLSGMWLWRTVANDSAGAVENQNSRTLGQYGFSDTWGGGAYGSSWRGRQNSRGSGAGYPAMTRPQGEYEIPSLRTQKFERARQGFRHLDPPNWEKIFLNPAIRQDLSVSDEEKYTADNDLALMKEMKRYKYAQSQEDQVENLPNLLEVLDRLNEANPPPNQPKYRFDGVGTHKEMTAEVAETIGWVVGHMPEPNELGPQARVNFDHYDQQIRMLLASGARRGGALNEVLSHLWKMQFIYSGTISLPQGFERGRTVLRLTDGSKRTWRTLTYQDNHYTFRGRYRDDVSHPKFFDGFGEVLFSWVDPNNPWD